VLATANVTQMAATLVPELASLYIDSFERVWQTATPVDWS